MDNKHQLPSSIRQVTEVGVIERVCYQDDRVFAQIRRLPTFVAGKDGESVKVDGLLFGEIGPNETAAETLILLDTHGITFVRDVARLLIGRKVVVTIDRTRSRIYASFNPQDPNSRLITRMHLIEARTVSPDASLTTGEAIGYLKSKGYDEKLIDAVINEPGKKASSTLEWGNGDELKIEPETLAVVEAGGIAEVPNSNVKIYCPPLRVFKG